MLDDRISELINDHYKKRFDYPSQNQEYDSLAILQSQIAALRRLVIVHINRLRKFAERIMPISPEEEFIYIKGDKSFEEIIIERVRMELCYFLQSAPNLKPTSCIKVLSLSWPKLLSKIDKVLDYIEETAIEQHLRDNK